MPLEEVGHGREGQGKVECEGAKHDRQVARRDIKEGFEARSPGDGVIPGLGGRWEGSCPYHGHTGSKGR